MSARVYGILIQTGNGKLRPAVGWDRGWATRAEAEACAERARRQAGWSAKVVSMTAEEADRNGWAVEGRQ